MGRIFLRPILLWILLFAIEETTDGYDDDQNGDDVSPDVSDARGGCDDVVVRQQALA